MSAEPLATQAEIWSRAIQPGEGDYPPEMARLVLRIRISDADAERVRQLSGKASSGSLSTSEERELDNYLNVGKALEFLKAKARLSLRNHGLPMT